jgi:hypothetical protein
MARNRMIKPEFWEDTKIASMTPYARLFFISLWNFADDKGMIEYNLAWLKAKCFPYDNVKIENLLNELIENNRVIIQNNIIWIRNFNKHQKIDRPRESNLSRIFDDTSTNAQRIIDEPSTTKYEENIKETENKKTRSDKSPYVCVFDSHPEFQSVFKDWIESRTKLKKPVTARAIELNKKDLERYAGTNLQLAIDIINQSIKKGWQGFFPLKEQQPDKPKIIRNDVFY